MNPDAESGRGTRARRDVRRALRRARELIGDHPAFLPVHLLLTPEGARDRRITRTTQLVIEGFPRSGNTFADEAFRLAQTQPVRVASHVHLPAQVQLAARRRVPTLVVIRQPVDAVISLVIWAPHVRPQAGLRHWIHFYAEIAAVRESFVLATFDEVISDFGAVIDRLNARFGTTFDRFDHTPDNVEATFAAIDRKQLEVFGQEGYAAMVPRPQAERAGSKAAMRAELDAPGLRAMRDVADAMYGALTDRKWP